MCVWNPFRQALALSLLDELKWVAPAMLGHRQQPAGFGNLELAAWMHTNAASTTSDLAQDTTTERVQPGHSSSADPQTAALLSFRFPSFLRCFEACESL